MENHIDKLFKWYLENKDALIKKYSNQHLVITDDGVVGHFSKAQDAYTFAISEVGAGKFIIQHCTEGSSGHVVHFVSPFVSVNP